MSASSENTGSWTRDLMPLALVVFGAWIVLAVLTGRCLYADGSHEFIRTLEAQNFVSLMESRRFAFYIYELPLVLAIKLGVTNLSVLRLAFGLGCFLPWVAALLCCYGIARKHVWLAVLACAAGYLNACYMAVGEHNLAHALYWPALFVILFARPLNAPAAAILLFSATALLFSYESQIVFGLVLAALSFWRFVARTRRSSSSHGPGFSLVLLVAGLLFLAAAGIGVHAVIKPELRANYSGFLASSATIPFHTGWTFTWTIGWALLMAAICSSENLWQFIRRPVGVTVLVVALLLWGGAPLLAPGALNPARLYENRGLNLLVPLLLTPMALILRFRPALIEGKSARLAQMTAVLLIVQSIWHIGATWQWHRDARELQRVLASTTGVVRLESSPLAKSSMRSRAGDFDWTWPCLSIALNPGRDVRSLVWSEPYLDPRHFETLWQPFIPTRPDTLPELTHYGLSFSNYIAALPQPR